MSGQSRDRRKRTPRNFTRHQVDRLEGRALLASIAEIGLTTGSNPESITTGPNGNLWFTEQAGDKIGEISTSGTVTDFALTSGSNPRGITEGPNGNLWFTEYDTGKIGEITTSGTITEFALASGSQPQEITAGSNGNLWFTEYGANKIGEIVPSGEFAGTITEFALASGSAPYGITDGPNGNLWFTEHGANKVGQIVPSGQFAGTVSTYSLSSGAGPYGITTGSDGNLWFAENGGGNIGQVTLGGSVVEYSIPGENGSPYQIVTGPSGDLYFTEGSGNNIIQMTTQGQFTDYAVPTSGAVPVGITQGPDNHIWFTEDSANQIGRLNLNPTSVNDTYTAAESTAANPASLTMNAAGGVLTNDTDPEGDSLQVLFAWTGNRGTNHGTVSLNPDGSFVYTPNNGFLGTDSFVYQATDGDDSSDTVTVTIHVDATPVAVNDTYTTPVSTTLTVSNAALGVIANDTDPNIGHTLTSSVVGQPSHGTLTLNADGSFIYIPNADYHGLDIFSYHDTDSDGSSTSNTARVTIYVDTAPVAVADSYTTDAGTLLAVSSGAQGVLANDTAYNGDTLTVASADVGTFSTGHGSIAMNADGTFSYTPSGSYTGTDTFSYYAYDGYQDSSSPASITFTVNPLPTGIAHTYEVLKDGSLSQAAPGVLAGDGGTGTLTAVIVAQPSHAADLGFTFNSDGSFAYVPASGDSGYDSFTYEVSDGIGYSAPQTVTLEVDAAPVGIPPTYLMAEGADNYVGAAQGLLVGATSTFDTPLSVIGLTQVSHTAVGLNGDGSFDYYSAAGYHGIDTFTYEISDGFTTSGVLTATLVDDTPAVALDQGYDDVQNTSLNLLAGQGLLVGATDADTNPVDTLTAVDLTQPSHGTLTVNADGSFSYIPTAGFYGPDSFTYTVNDGYQDGNTATVSLYVDQPPVGQSDSYNVVEDTSLAMNAASGVLANDTETDEQPLTAGLVSTTAHGSLTLFQDGSFHYIPVAGYYGNDTFTYKANDGITDSPTTTVTIHVDAPPVGFNDDYNAVENTPLVVAAASGVLADDTQAQGETLTSSLVANPSHGTLTLYEDGSFQYIPNAGYYGNDSFTYTPYDGIANGNVTTVSLFVDAPPVAVNDAFVAKEGLPLTVGGASGVLANDVQAQGEPLTSSVVANPSHGTVTLNPDGSFTYIPASQFFGTDSFTYRDDDGNTSGNTATVTLNVLEDFAPTANNVSQAVAEGGTTVNAPGLLAGDTDSNGEPLTAVLVAGPAHGSLSFNGDGSYVYIPNASFGAAGIDSFTFRTFDGVLTSPVATVTLIFDGDYIAPVAQAHSYTVAEGATLTGAAPGLLAGATDSWSLPLTAVVTGQPSHGTLTVTADGSFAYTPAVGFYGTDSFAYQANNGHDDSTAQAVTLTVTQVLQAPVAVGDSFSTTAGLSPLSVAAAAGLLANDTDPQGLPLTAVLVSSPSHGTLSLDPDGAFTYSPALGFFGTDTFSYRASDGSMTSGPATVTVTVHAPARIVPNDYDGDGKSDIAVYIASMGAYDIHYSSGFPDQIIPFGTPGLGNAIPAPGDYDHSGKTELAVYYPEGGQLIYRPANGGADVVVSIGLAGPGNTVPAPGDYFGTGQDDVAVYVPSLGAFEIRNPSTGVVTVTQFGGPNVNNAIPAPGDYDGSGKTEVALYIPSAGLYAFRPTAGYADQIIPFGAPGLGQVIPMPGDYDGSGHDELAIYMPGQGRFAYRPGYSGPDVNIVYGIAGNGQTLPSPGDYTGVGHDQLAAYIPAHGIFAIRVDDGQADLVRAIGVPGLGLTSAVTVVDEALAQMPDIVSILSLDWPGQKKKG